MKTHDGYVGIKPCGCMVAVVVDNPRWIKDTARTIARFVRNGYRVEPAVLDEVRHKLGPCKCKKD